MRKENRITLITIVLVLSPVITSVAAHIAGWAAVKSSKPMTIHLIANFMLVGIFLWFVLAWPIKAAHDVMVVWERLTRHRKIRKLLPVSCSILFGLAAAFYMYFMLACSRYDGVYSRGESTSGIAYITGPFVLIAPVMIAGYVIGLVASGIIRRFVDDRADEMGPYCVNCGYSLRGLDQSRCPECGHDFDS